MQPIQSSESAQSTPIDEKHCELLSANFFTIRMEKVIIYIDNSANIKGFKELHHNCNFISSPYDDSARQPKSQNEVAPPSNMQWRDWHAWEQVPSWDSTIGSEKLEAIYTIIGKDPQERRDGLHLDSAYKGKVHLFLTEDKGNIVKYRGELEPLLNFRILYPPTELHLIKEFIVQFLQRP